MSGRPILVMAGGTGGHVYPALAVARALKAHSQDVVWLGTHRGLESTVVPAAGIDVEWISVKGLRRKGITSLLIAPFQLGWALMQALGVILRRRPAAVLGMGGFVSGPGGLAAWLTRRPLVIHEQNAAAGLTNRLLARLARVVLQAFPGSFNSRVNAETVGNPVREDIAAVASPADRYNSRNGPLRLLVLGGSQGALALNQTVPEALSKLPAHERPVIRHQCGSRTLDTARDSYEKYEVDAELMPFIDDMASAYAWADLVVCRAGALTVAELCAVGLPALFVPYPGAVDDHQTANARPMADAGAAVIIDQSMLTADVLAGQLREWLSSRADLLGKAERAHGLDKPSALARITELCLEQAGGAA
ncbi:MAG: undecaprenyldiphospho-muramoylpentapeptide beta-N-acetylglucosaminyltransferase [Gammaproteobacteria bacterium]|jgi:UDP-N-acetylglucosamine--N-acetylmuramyl-(pentapeptide) pyrophosphoryl-undecaprenol N-acetylglucosamine transferase|nr:undecaprenyldiphospho-muramoylpentapeptide beta-N-acetylglucosaminyltransferase [Gammaproteobacteria bacterium]MDH3748994.1 undecaprenyldiphospho-muramoylpentapeptide beta-N-acetylglucosaminyltransferase [Gammaproteobacteria bacterium]MDH3805579.1 undecaprenyldiphospho-muramoylpentapeptide beta-N-acetylglucosaminyltransferase [Gammaproteobacteria bacterium]